MGKPAADGKRTKKVKAEDDAAVVTAKGSPSKESPESTDPRSGGERPRLRSPFAGKSRTVDLKRALLESQGGIEGQAVSDAVASAAASNLEEVTALAHELEESKARIEALQRELSARAEQSDDVQRRFDAQRKESEEYRARAEQLQAQVDSAREAMEAQRKRADALDAKLEQRSQATAEEGQLARQTFDKELQSVEEKHRSELLRISAEHREKLQLREKELEATQQEIEQLERARAEERTKLQALTEELKTLQNRARENQKFEEGNAALEAELSELKQKLVSSEAEVDEGISKLERKEAELKAAQERIEQLSREYTSSDSELDSLRQQVSQSRQQMAERERVAGKAAELTRRSFEEQLQSLKDKYEAERQTSERRARHLQDEVATQASEISRYAVLLEDARNKILELSQRAAPAEEELEELEQLPPRQAYQAPEELQAVGEASSLARAESPGPGLFERVGTWFRALLQPRS